ncbi:MAG: radical SAM protein [Muribaculum sp.]|nr:radical SAM protein [Muribaculum sp.]
MNEESYSRKICIATNYSCNLNCIYCFEKNRNESEFNVDEAFAILMSELHESTPKGTKIKLHGGEPFMVFPKIKELCERLWAADISESFHIHLTTNGTLVHGEIQSWLYEKRNLISVKLSLDGDRLSNEINRPGSFDKIDLPFFLKCWPDIRISMTISPQTIPYLSRNLKFLHENGFKDIVSHFALLKNWNDYSLTKELYEQLDIMADYYLKNKEIQPCYLFRGDISLTLTQNKSVFSCLSANCKAYDYKTKKYYPCYMYFPSMAGEKISRELAELYSVAPQINNDERCINCPFINLCPTCHVENFISRGDFSLRDMSLCKYRKIVFAKLFKYEYERIRKLDNPTINDYKKMLAVKKWGKEVEEVLKKYVSSKIK